MAAKLEELEDYVKHKIKEEKSSHSALSAELKRIFPGQSGLSVRSIQRFCEAKDIRKTSRLPQEAVEAVVREAVIRVGPTYGRKMTRGLLASEGVKVSEKKVGKALQAVCPSYHQARVNKTHRSVNPVPYSATYFGQKLHIDQNEKLVMFGVTHICAVDGYSGKILSFITMPIKNNIEIYENMLRPILMEYGLFDQLRVDHGKEWVLSLYVQEKLAHLRYSVVKPPHRQTSSTLNHTIECYWPEVNHRVNYPIKSCLLGMQDRGDFDIDSMTHRFCVSWIAMNVCVIGIRQFVQAWNCHYIPGKGIPNELQRSSRTVKLPEEMIPKSEAAVSEYTTLGGHLTINSVFGNDPLANRPPLLNERNLIFQQTFPDYSPVFHAISNGESGPLTECIKCFISLTERLATLV